MKQKKNRLKKHKVNWLYQMTFHLSLANAKQVDACFFFSSCKPIYFYFTFDFELNRMSNLATLTTLRSIDTCRYFICNWTKNNYDNNFKKTRSTIYVLGVNQFSITKSFSFLLLLLSSNECLLSHSLLFIDAF